MPPHWFVPLHSSTAEDRKTAIKHALEGKGKLDKLWKGSDGNLYAHVKDCPGLDDDEDLKGEIGVIGPLIGLEREV